MIIKNVEMMIHILSNKPEVYKITVKNLEEELYDDVGPLTIEMITYKFSVK